MPGKCTILSNEDTHEKHARPPNKNAETTHKKYVDHAVKTPEKHTILPNEDAYEKHARPSHKNADTTLQKYRDTEPKRNLMTPVTRHQ
ncbi:hypothetical protein C2G38_2216879 [Gigaspora rosea]|uniref:Uncharacterized protein n=1 Tax=Gigaspora rosea TaxID=44941 RepID=A0A397U8C8_9GLOM|nr:hypothetical protein C2G38_2216879 [Gigaspora rosea]